MSGMAHLAVKKGTASSHSKLVYCSGPHPPHERDISQQPPHVLDGVLFRMDHLDHRIEIIPVFCPVGI
jgi:hypothetical protein